MIKSEHLRVCTKMLSLHPRELYSSKFLGKIQKVCNVFNNVLPLRPLDSQIKAS
jgi:hypothetical protein